MRALASLLVTVVLASVLAGCSEPGLESGGELVVTSAPLVEVKSPDGTTSTQGAQPSLPPGTQFGHLAGVVVDQSITPIEGALVSIPGLDLSDQTQRGGGFSFTDLVAGQYFVRAEAPGYATAETVVEVAADTFSRIKFVLEALPPPTPKVTTFEFVGFIDVTQSDFGFIYGCGSCEFEFLAGEPGLQAIVIDAVMDPYNGVGTGSVGSNGFYWDLAPASDRYEYVRSGSAGNPMQAIVLADELGNSTEAWGLSVYPNSFPAPEVNKSFKVFVTVWVNAMPPAGWKVGDPVP